MRARRCWARTVENRRCLVAARKGSTRCYFHDPATQQEQQENRRRAIRTCNAKRRLAAEKAREEAPEWLQGRRLDTLDDVRAVNCDLIRAVCSGEVELRTGAEILGIVKMAMRGMSEGNSTRGRIRPRGAL